MPVRSSQGDVAFLLGKLGMTRLKKGGAMYGGIGADGVFRRCQFDYHSDQTPVATGTATAIARALGFSNVLAMKEYLDNQGWKKR